MTKLIKINEKISKLQNTIGKGGDLMYRYRICSVSEVSVRKRSKEPVSYNNKPEISFRDVSLSIINFS